MASLVSGSQIYFFPIAFPASISLRPCASCSHGRSSDPDVPEIPSMHLGSCSVPGVNDYLEQIICISRQSLIYIQHEDGLSPNCCDLQSCAHTNGVAGGTFACSRHRCPKCLTISIPLHIQEGVDDLCNSSYTLLEAFRVDVGNDWESVWNLR